MRQRSMLELQNQRLDAAYAAHQAQRIAALETQLRSVQACSESVARTAAELKAERDEARIQAQHLAVILSGEYNPTAGCCMNTQEWLDWSTAMARNGGAA